MLADPPSEVLYPHLSNEAERARWKMADIPFDAIERDRVPPTLPPFIREIALSELTTFNASRKFLHEFADDLDFSQWVSVWFYEETRHPQVLMRWLSYFGVTFDQRAMMRGRAATPFMKERIGTLVTNVISEMIASAGYVDVARRVDEPVLALIARNLAADEARHASGFYSYARKLLAASSDRDADRATALKVLHLWLRDSEHVGHPVNQLQVRKANSAADLAPGKPKMLDLGSTRIRVCRMIGTLVGIEITDPDEVLGHVRALSRSASLAADERT